MPRNVSEKQKDKLMESVKSKNRQYGVGLVTVSNPVPGRLDAVEVSDMLEQQKSDLSARKRISSSLSTTIATAAFGFKILRILMI